MSSTAADEMTGSLQGLLQGRASIFLIGFLSFVPIFYLFFKGEYKLLIGLMMIGATVIAWRISKVIALALLFTFLLTLGDLRRIIDMLSSPTSLDPLLLVGPLCTIYVTVPLLMRLQLSDNLSKATLGLLSIMVLEVVNPTQGPIAVGLAGALFWIIPVLWFWVGRWLASEKILFTVLYRVFFPIGMLDALLGLFQTYFGYLPWEEAWAKPLIGQYLQSNGQVRPFGFSTSSVEYALTIIIAIVLVVAAIFAGRRLYAAALPVLIPALLFASSRGAIIRVLFAVSMIWAVRNGKRSQWIPRLILVLSFGMALMVYSAATVAPEETLDALSDKTSSAELATAHVTQGLAHPLDEKYSTGGIHLAMVGVGIAKGFTYPIGRGLGAVTLGAGKFGADASVSGSTEIDISDAFLAMGAVGGILYLFIIYRSCSIALEYVRTGPKILSLACIGLLASTLGAWVAPSYHAGFLIWFCIGTLCIMTNHKEPTTA